jgi:hypothetical protein
MKDFRIESIVAGVLFITATAATMASQMIVAPMLEMPNLITHIAENRAAFTWGVLLELTNALASGGIAIALFTVIWRCVLGLAVGYLGLRLIEAGLGAVAAGALLVLLSPIDPAVGLAFHKWGFLLVLTVFSIGTFILYPVLFRFRLVPVVLSLWGLIGGALLLVSCTLILFGKIEIGGRIDLFLSLPIWINEMALALWLILRGVNVSHIQRQAPAPHSP